MIEIPALTIEWWHMLLWVGLGWPLDVAHRKAPNAQGPHPIFIMMAYTMAPILLVYLLIYLMFYGGKKT